MEWFTPSDSSCVKRAGYDAGKRELRIVYENGRQYAYGQVPQTVFDTCCRSTAAATRWAGSSTG